MKSKVKKILSILMVISLILTPIPGQKVEAKTVNYKKLYREYLKKHGASFDEEKYFLKDINGDKIPELFGTLENGVEQVCYECFLINNGKVVSYDTMGRDFGMFYNLKKKRLVLFGQSIDFAGKVLIELGKNKVRKLARFYVSYEYYAEPNGKMCFKLHECWYEKGNSKRKNLKCKSIDKLEKLKEKYININSKNWKWLKPSKNSLYSYKKMIKFLGMNKKAAAFSELKQKYYKWFKNHKNDGLYCIGDDYKKYIYYKDINGDGVKEAFLDTGGGGADVVLTYIKGKVKSINVMTHATWAKKGGKVYLFTSDHYYAENTFSIVKKNGKVIPVFCYFADRNIPMNKTLGYYKLSKWSAKKRKFTKTKKISKKKFAKYLNGFQWGAIGEQ